MEVITMGLRLFIIALVIVSCTQSKQITSADHRRPITLLITYVKKQDSVYITYAMRYGVKYRAALHHQLKKGDKITGYYTPTPCDSCFIPINHY